MPGIPVRLVTAAVALAMLLVACGTSDDAATTATTADTVADTQSTEPVAVEPEVAQADAAEPEVAQREEESAATATEVAAAFDGGDRFPSVVAVAASTNDGSSWQFNVTLSSTYDTPQRYADAWRVLDADGNELGIRVLTHDHANEQPFTRSHNVDVDAAVTTVFVEGRDQANGWSGERFEVTLSR